MAGVLVFALMALAAILTAVMGSSTCADPPSEPELSVRATRGVPGRYLTLYRGAGRQHGVPWPVLAAIGSIESDHGRSRAPGVHSGVNSFGCCASPMQFNLRDGPPSTWDRYGVDGDGDGNRDVYQPADAIASAANYLRALLRGSDGDLRQAVFGYNHSQTYVDDVLARARAYAGMSAGELERLAGEATAGAGCAEVGAVRPANLSLARRVSWPRAFRLLPQWAMSGGRGAQVVDARIYDNVVWIVRRYRLRVTAARESGHRTHGDGTALDLVPADRSGQLIWHRSAGRLARHLGWSPACASSGTRPACELAPAIQFVGYEGYPGHGSPRTCTGSCAPHLHVSWASPCYGSSALAAPCPSVTVFEPRGWRPGLTAPTRMRDVRTRHSTRSSSMTSGDQMNGYALGRSVRNRPQSAQPK